MGFTDTHRGAVMDTTVRPAIDRLFLAVIFLIPFIPRPTIEHPARFLAPLVISALLYVYALWFLTRKTRTSLATDKTAVLGYILVFTLFVYLARILVNGEWGELQHFAGRSLAAFLMIAFLGWMNKRGVTVKEAYRPLFIATLILSALVIFMGITGISLFGENSVRPPRTYGFTFPFYKTDAIPRSYGEFGIIISAAWGYFLLYRDEFSRKRMYLYGFLLVMATIISQSRSTYLGMMMVTIGYFLLKYRLTKRTVAALMVAALVMPIIISIVPKDLPVIRSLVGEKTFEANVYKRFSQYDAAIRIIKDEPVVMALGINHKGWNRYFSDVEGEDNALHNHFLSMIIFLGLIGGLANLLVYVIPMAKLASMGGGGDKETSMLILAAIGMLIGLNFYEGFFSMTTAFITSTMWYSFRTVGGGVPPRIMGGDAVR